METWAKEKLITEIQSLQEKLSFYQAKLRGNNAHIPYMYYVKIVVFQTLFEHIRVW